MTSINTRDDQIAVIRSRSDRLREIPGRLEECYEQVKKGYESESDVNDMARVIPITDRTPSDFRVLTVSEARRIGEFNDTSYHWDLFCSQLGRSIAFAETRYMFEEFQNVTIEEEQLISVKDPSFDALGRAVETLRSRGGNPDILCAPIGLMVPFAGSQSLTIDWNASPKEVVILPGGTRLKLLWSSGASPLDRFVVLDSSRMRWTVKLDSETHGRLTVAIGESRTNDGQPAVVFLAETVAKFQLDSEAAVAVGLDGEPLDADAYVNREHLQ